jgi:hypothetical protein
MLLGKPDILRFSQLVFLPGMDVRVIEIERQIDPGRSDCFDDFSRTGRATGVQEHPPVPLGRIENRTLEFVRRKSGRH